MGIETARTRNRKDADRRKAGIAVEREIRIAVFRCALDHSAFLPYKVSPVSENRRQQQRNHQYQQSHNCKYTHFRDLLPRQSKKGGGTDVPPPEKTIV